MILSTLYATAVCLFLIGSTTAYKNVAFKSLCRLQKKVFASTSSVIEEPDTVTQLNSQLYNWDFVDSIYLITTTTSDPNRLLRTKKELEAVNIWNRVKVLTFQPDDEDRIRGCYTSHIKVYETALKENGKKKDFNVMVLEDNVEKTKRINPSVVDSIRTFLSKKEDWSVFHLGYMMYVPNFAIHKLSSEEAYGSDQIVQLISGPDAALGTSAYLISKSGILKLLEFNRENGFISPIPNVIAKLFCVSRHGPYPMLFHRANKVASLVNPKFDDFRKVVFSPSVYSTWERLMCWSGMNNNQLFPTVCATILMSSVVSGAVVYNSLQ